jgi:chondroitin 4-sulfotransferase 11
MFVSHRKKCIFIHIQKTAGYSIEAAVRNDDPALEVDRFGGRKHLFAREARALLPAETWNGYYRFAFVRNPWDRLVSWYSRCMQGGRGNAFAQYVQENAPTFADFITRTTTGIAERTTHNQVDYVTDEAGELIVDFVGRYERLAADYAAIRARLGLQYNLPRWNTSSHTAYREYYTADTRAIVAARFARDIARFGYEF